MVALRLEILVVDQHLAELDRPLAGERLDQLALAVAGDAGDADDLAGLDLDVEAVDGVATLVVFGEQARDLERDGVLRGLDPRRRRPDDGVADHHRRHLARRDRADLAAADALRRAAAR